MCCVWFSGRCMQRHRGAFVLHSGSARGNVAHCGLCRIWHCLPCRLIDVVRPQGTLLFIAASDVLPDLLENDKKHSPGVVLRHLLLMAVGVVALGLTLLHHEHCAPGGHAHAH